MLEFCKKIWNCCYCFCKINEHDNYNAFNSEVRENGNGNVSVSDDKFCRTPTSFDRTYSLSNEPNVVYNDIYR